MANVVSFTLLENGLDFIDSGLEHLGGTPSVRDLKYGALHVFGGIELLLKERLRRHDWKEIYAKPAQATDENYETGDFRSVDLLQLIGRLEEKCGVVVTPKHQADLHALRVHRKRLEHFRVHLDALTLIAAVAECVNFAISFLMQHLSGQPLTSQEAELLSAIREKLAAFDALVDARGAEVQPQVDKHEAAVACSACLQEARVLGDGNPHCLFCGESVGVSVAARHHVTHVLGISEYEAAKDGEPLPLHRCPSCEWEGSLVESDGEFLCFQCAYQATDLDRCLKCNEPYPSEDGESVCSVCFERAVEDDD